MIELNFKPFHNEEVVWLEEVDSTQLRARALLRERQSYASKTSLPFWVIAHRQTRGYGTRGRSWRSQGGNFHGTFVVTLCDSRARFEQLSLRVAQCIVSALNSFLPKKYHNIIDIKKPNDIIVENQNKIYKLGGILVEVEGQTAYIGAGINLLHSPSLQELELDPYKKEEILTPSSLKEQFGLCVEPPTFFYQFRKQLLPALQSWETITDIYEINIDRNYGYAK